MDNCTFAKNYGVNVAYGSALSIEEETPAVGLERREPVRPTNSAVSNADSTRLGEMVIRNCSFLQNYSGQRASAISLTGV